MDSVQLQKEKAMHIIAFIINKTKHPLRPVSHVLKNFEMGAELKIIPARSYAMQAFELIGLDMDRLNFLMVDSIHYMVGLKDDGEMVYFRFQIQPPQALGGSLILAYQAITEDGLKRTPISYSSKYPRYRVGFIIG